MDSEIPRADGQAKTAIVFGGMRLLKTLILADRLLRIAERREDFRVLALCDAGEAVPRSRLATTTTRLLGAALKKAFNPSQRFFFVREKLWDLSSLGKRYGVRVLVPPERNINHPAFVDYLRRELKPDFAFCLGCQQVLKGDLLAVFAAAVNHHSGVLPAYRGWAATEWSIYQGEPDSGFAFHYVSEKVDRGPIILDGRVPVADLTAEELNHRKAIVGADRLEEVVERMIAGDPGTPQAGPGRYYGRTATRELTEVDPPDSITWAELQRRIRAFGYVRMVLGGRLCRVTEVKRLDGPPRRAGDNVFSTADGVSAAAARVSFLPWRLAKSASRVLPDRQGRRGRGGKPGAPTPA